MSWSSGGSSSPGFRAAAGRRNRGPEARSPVRYRENPMAYEPAVLCECNPRRKVPRWISWSKQNPGRRYYACVDAMNGRGCVFVDWHDDPLPEFWSDLIGDLRDEVCRLRALAEMPRSDEMPMSNEVVVALQEEVKEKNAQIAAMKLKFDSVVYVALVFVLGLVAGKLFFQ